MVRGGFGWFYENFNGLNYRNSVISNGTLSQQASVTYVYGANGSQIPNQQAAVFPNQITDPSQFSASNISLVDPHFHVPNILQGSLQRLNVRSCVTPSSPSALLGRTESTWLRPVHTI